ncbi:MAG: hypothetical protein V2A74_02940 [bacterium]
MLNKLRLPQPESVLRMEGFRSQVVRDGLQHYSVLAASALYYEKQNRAELNDLRIVFYVVPFSDGATTKPIAAKEMATMPAVQEKAGNLRADSGILYMQEDSEGHKRNDMDLVGDVEYTGSDGSVIITSKMYYRDAENRLFSDEGFERRLPTDNGLLISKGKSFETNRERTVWKDTGAKIQLVPYARQGDKNEKNP